jgi:hypothetical protein
MKTYQLLARLSRRLARPRHRPILSRRSAVNSDDSRRGTVIIVVLALLGMLVLIGFFTLAFTASENQSATYFAAASKVNLPVGLDPNLFFDDALRQIIIGPSPSEKQSALWGGRSSLVPTMFGRDLSPYNGAGVNLIWNSTLGQASVDQNYDSVPDDGTAGTQDNRALTFLNFSPSAAIAWQGTTAFVTGAFVRPTTTQTNLLYIATVPGTSGGAEPAWPTTSGATVVDGGVTWTAAGSVDFNNYPLNGSQFPDPDFTSTYADINSPFLSYDALVPNPASATGLTRLITPSFHRPQYLRNATGSLLNPVPTANWYIDPLTASRVLYPHIEHTAIDSSGNVTTIRRFITNTYPDLTGTITSPFVIPGDGATPPPAEGVWTTPAGGPIAYTVDTDNDGVPDSNYMDLGFPLMTNSDGTQQFVAMAAIQIRDADGLLNLNAGGNRGGQAAVPSPNNFGGTGTFLSRSNLGLSASEVNVEWAFNARPIAGGLDFPGTPAALATALQQYTCFFRAPADSGTLPANNFDPTAGTVSYELANMEWWNILNGRPQLTPSASPTTIPATVSGSSLPGRWGENLTRLDPNVNLVLSGTPVAAGLPMSTDPWPLPGTSGVDDNFNSPESGVFKDAQGILHPAFVTPLDYFSTGFWFTGAEGKTRLLIAEGAQKFPQYSNYFINNFPLTTVQWATPFAGGLMTGGGAQLLVDEPDETFTEPSAVATQPDDNTYSPADNTLHLQGTDWQSFGGSSRTASLAQFNLTASARAGQIRQRLTSTSWDLKSFSKEFLGIDTTAGAGPYDARRLWEFTDLSGATPPVGPFRFPPNFGTTGIPPGIIQAPAFNVMGPTTSQYPLRPDLAHLLWTLADPKQQQTATALLLPQRPMSINGLTEQTQTGTDSSGNPIYTFRIRPLTPHPSTTNPPGTLLSKPIWDSTVGGSGSPTGIPFPTTSRPENLSTGNVAQQEWLARYDRQRLARDIYTLLYLTGGGSDIINYAATSNAVPGLGVPRPLYTDDQLQEMAQFAVNLVDQLDPDSNITIFEYDKNLADGWNLDDNPYDAVADSQPPYNIPPVDRGVVYGVERQQLALNEAMVAFSQQAVDTTPPTAVKWDHPDTQWDDTKQWAALYLELDNIGPTNVNFNNEQWQIAIKQSPIVQTPSLFYGAGTSGERRLTFQSTQPQLVAGPAAGGFKPRMTIGGLIGSVAGTTYDQVNSLSGNPAVPNPSYLAVDPNDTAGSPGNTGFDYQFPIAPRAAYVSPAAPPFGMTTALDLDLTQPGTQNQYWVVPPNPADPTGNADGSPSLISTPAGLSPGTQLLNFTDPITEVTGTISSVPGAHIFPETALVVRIELKRRVDPNRNQILPTDANVVAESTDNPWIVVDYMDVPVSVLALKKTGNASDYSLQIQNQLGNPAALADPPLPAQPYHHYIPTGGAVPLVSTERSQPYYHDFTLNPFNPTGGANVLTPNGPYIVASSTVYPRNGGAATLKPQVWQGNSFGQDNDAAGFDPGTVSGTPVAAPAHPLYQPHYDRDFASIIELFNVPLWGPYGPLSPAAMNIPGVSSGNSVALSSGLTHLMASRTNEIGTAVAGPLPTPEVLAGTDYIPTDISISPKQHYNGYGVAGYRFQHPEGGDATIPLPATDFTENRWHRMLGLVEVPTRSHRQLEEPPYQITAGTINGSLGFYRTPGKINLNTLRHPDVLAGLLDDGDVYSLSYSPAFPGGLNFPINLSVPLSLPDLNATDQFQAPSPIAGQVRDWWTQFVMARDGIDPLLPTAVPTAGTGLPLPGLPRTPSGTAPPAGASVTGGSHPFRGLGFSAYASAPASTSGGIDANRYNGTLDSTILRTLPGDPVTPTSPAVPPTSPDVRRRLFELGTSAEHFADGVDYATRNRVLSKILQNTTTRSNVFLVWIQIDFFQAKDVNPPNGVVRIGARLNSSPGPYRGFFVIDRSQALSLMGSQYLPAATTSPFVFSMNQSFNYQSLVLFRQRIQ